MGGAPSFKSFKFTFPIIITITTLILIAGVDSRENPPSVPSLEDDNGATTTPSPPDDSSGKSGKKPGPFRPTTAVVMGVLTTTFSLTFLLLLYIKHCNGGHFFTAPNYANSEGAQPSHERKNSGIDHAVVESLPLFRFGSLRGQRNGLDCAVCLTRFEDTEVLRLLPKCKHAFHKECVDTWLDAHSTCPLCRHKVNSEDIEVLPPPSQQQSQEEEGEALDIERGRNNDNNNNNNAAQPKNLGFRRVSGRHSSVGERRGGDLQIVSQPSNDTATSSFRGSVDSASRKKRRKSESVGSGPRKDGTLLARDAERKSEEHRLEHRIIISPGGTHQKGKQNQRWSDVQPSAMLYLTSEMIIGGGSFTRGGRNGGGGGILRSVSEVTGMSRMVNRERGRQGERGDGEEREGVATRWLGWISKSQRR